MENTSGSFPGEGRPTGSKTSYPTTPVDAPYRKKLRARDENYPGRAKKMTTALKYEAQEVATRLVGDPEYLENVRVRLMAGKLDASLEAMLWHYAYGKPVQRREVRVDQVDRSIASLSSTELAARAKLLAARLTRSSEVSH